MTADVLVKFGAESAPSQQTNRRAPIWSTSRPSYLCEGARLYDGERFVRKAYQLVYKHRENSKKAAVVYKVDADGRTVRRGYIFDGDRIVDELWVQNGNLRSLDDGRIEAESEVVVAASGDDPPPCLLGAIADSPVGIFARGAGCLAAATKLCGGSDVRAAGCATVCYELSSGDALCGSGGSEGCVEPIYCAPGSANPECYDGIPGNECSYWVA